MKSNVNDITAKLDDKYDSIDDEISTIRSSVGTVKNGLTSQIRQINVSSIFKLKQGSQTKHALHMLCNILNAEYIKRF